MGKKANYIESIEINKLYGKFDFKCEFNRDVNILIGRNGGGKTTLLNILQLIINGNLNNDFPDISYKEIKINFDNSKYIQSQSNIDSSFGTYYLRDKNFKNSLDVYLISTFDILINEIFGRNNSVNCFSKTQLDLILFKLINSFKVYQFNLNQLIENEVSVLDNKIKTLLSQESCNNEELTEIRNLLKQKNEIIVNINLTKNYFLDLVNDSFTDKKITFDENNSIVFFKRSNNQNISIEQLSSGEKQILIILLSVVIQDNKPCIFLIDNPELSVHLGVQHRIIDMIQILNNNCQIIMATQAPGLLAKGWRDKAIQINLFN